MPLTNTAIKAQKPDAKPVKLFDQGGLFLFVSPAGGKWWRFTRAVHGADSGIPFAHPGTDVAICADAAVMTTPKPANSTIVTGNPTT